MSVVRRATRRDERELFALVRAFPTPTPPEFSAFRHAFESMLADLSAALFVAEVDAQLVGYLTGYRHVTFYAVGYTAWVDEIFVAAHARKMGTGRRLMENFEEWAVQRDCKLVGLATAGASAFYERLGYASKAGYYKKYLRASISTAICEQTQKPTP
jgi:GNAT superfamily N-acetyltransferase